MLYEHEFKLIQQCNISPSNFHFDIIFKISNTDEGGEEEEGEEGVGEEAREGRRDREKKEEKEKKKKKKERLL